MKREKEPVSFEGWMRYPSIQVKNNSEALGWTCVYLQVADLSKTEGNQLGPIVVDPIISMLLQGKTTLRTQHKYPGLNPLGTPYSIGYANLVPTDFVAEGGWDGGFKAGFWTLSLKTLYELAAQSSKSDPSKIELIPTLHFYDPLLIQLLLALVNELQTSSFLSPLYADSLAHTIMLHLLKHYSTAAKIAVPQKGCLSPSQKAILEDYIAANLAENIQITVLAQLLHLSVSHLERLFRASYGVPIYRYVIQRRIEHAKQLLIDKNLSLLQVSVEAGFTSQSHFNHHFKTQMGISPKRFRDTWRF